MVELHVPLCTHATQPHGLRGAVQNPGGKEPLNSSFPFLWYSMYVCIYNYLGQQ